MVTSQRFFKNWQATAQLNQSSNEQGSGKDKDMASRNILCSSTRRHAGKAAHPARVQQSGDVRLVWSVRSLAQSLKCLKCRVNGKGACAASPQDI